MKALSSYFFITMRELDLANISLSDIENLGVFRNTFTANEKYLFRGSKNLLSPIQIQVSLKPKTLSDFFVSFLESTSNFKHFIKKENR